jgi:thiosulfate dehydrogenase
VAVKPGVAALVLLVTASGFAGEPTVTAGDGMPPGPSGDAIRLGKNLVVDTQHTARPYVGNGLNCASCHEDAGTKRGALPLTGLAAQFPAYSPRTGRTITLEDRINGCFERSMNGRALPDGSAEMTALVAYVGWLSRDTPRGGELPGRSLPRLDMRGLKPDPARGKILYASKCALCHGPQGAGIYDDGNVLIPAVWGDKSFNIGAGMARLSNAAAFVKANMPQNAPGSLTTQEAIDIAAYFIAQPRPDFALKGGDWPHGGKPADARY